MKFITRVRTKTDLPLAVGFGISTPDIVQSITDISDGVVVGSELLKSNLNYGIETSATIRADTLRSKVAHLCTGVKQATAFGSIFPSLIDATHYQLKAHFGKVGGQFIPETLSFATRLKRNTHSSKTTLSSLLSYRISTRISLVVKLPYTLQPG